MTPLTYVLHNPESAILIESIQTGYLLHTFNADEAGEIIHDQYAFDVPPVYMNAAKVHTEALVDLLWNILDALGETGSDHYDSYIQIKTRNARKIK
ncbi:MAG: hypothetical protein EHM41_00210 [Chloroflexi bacterium]|nr:MAG: hypothetical protein EHM41_00210 [Chloroflexota bacterium]